MKAIKTLNNIKSIILIGLLLFFVVLMISLSLEYFPISSNVAFLRIKQWIFREYSTPLSNFWYTAFYIHVITSTFCLLAGFTQFFKPLFFTKWHRFFGKFYVIVVLGLAAPSGLIMSFFANGGISSIVAFVTLSVLWIFSTIKAIVTVKQKQYFKHAAWMMISYALALSALTLRAWKWVFTNLYEIDLNPIELYRLVAWLGWIPNLLIALILIYFGFNKKIINSQSNTRTYIEF
jgi:hypothetical protein